MTNEQHLDDVAAKNESSLQTLVRSITFSQREFSLILLRCNNVALRKRIVQRLYKLSPLQIRAIILPPSVKTLYTSILEKLGDEKPNALIIFGLESVNNLDTVLTSANQVREEFRKNFSFPLLLWVNDEVLQNLIRLATDFENWATTIEFQSTNDELVNFLQQKTDEIFADKANPDAETCWQLKAAVNDLQNREQVLDPAIKASVKFVIGLDDYLHGKIDSALEAYQTSLAFWQENYNLERQGILLYHIASAYYSKAEKNLRCFQNNCEESKHYLQQCINIFEQAQRPDLVAKYINKLGEVLRHLKAWSDLKILAEKSLALHQNYGSLLQIAQDYGFLAEVALERSRCDEANLLAQQTIHFLDRIPNLKPYHFCLYRLILARCQENLGQLKEAVSNLEKAREESKFQYDPKAYICILDNLHRLYFDANKYVEAFTIKQEQIQIEYQHGFRAFIGIYYLNSHRKAINTIIQSIEKSGKITQEIPASGREKDVKSLLKRISSTDHKLIIIHGQSGVGKSHLLNAGLIPVLQQQAIGERDALPILLRGYTDWIRMLGTYLVEAFEQIRSKKLSIAIDSIEAFVEQLRKNADLNLLTVLIFDQYEEFFIKTDLDNRRSFYDFLCRCLNIPFVKVIISLREDYLHSLLEWERLIDISAIDNDMLILKNRYPLANFSIEVAKKVIHSLTEKSHFFLEPPLIDKLVEDLAKKTGEVRPIELQIVGTQLQTHKITSLEKYNQFEKEEKLVQRFLKEIIKDCGASNENAAELVLYLLTSANGTRPIKTYFDLKAGLASESDKLDLVLEILLKSGLVSLIPELHTKRYQLAHDYLVELIRNRVEFPIKEQLLKTFFKQAGKYTTQILTEFDYITEIPDDTERPLNNRYEVTEQIGSGGFSYTYLAKDTHRPRKPMCVVKHLQPARTDEVFLDIARRLFKTEAEILDLLGHHDQIPQLMAYFEENQQFYLVQEYIRGHTLQEELTLDNCLGEANVVDLLKDVLQILVFVHSRGVIHRDIKPSNLIRRQKDKRIVLIDFGAVKKIQLQQQQENPTVAIGTAGYAPPEQFMGHPRLNSDIYALGMIGIQALTGTPAKNLERELTTALPWRHLAEETTEEFAAILDKMVAFDFEKRYQSVEEVLKALDEFP